MDPLPDSRDLRPGGSRDVRGGGGRSRSVSPNRGYERKRPPPRSTKDVPSKRGDGDAKPEADEVRDGSGGSRGSSPRRARDKAPLAKTSRSSSQDEPPERPDQSPDTSAPEEGQEAKAGGGDTYSDWSDDDDDDILTRGDAAAADSVKKEVLSDAHNDATSEDKPEDAGDPNLIEVDAVPVSPEESPRSAAGGEAISDVLDIDWSVLVKEVDRPKDGAAATAEKRSSARERYSGARVLARIGISRDLAGEDLAHKVVEFCQAELAKDKAAAAANQDAAAAGGAAVAEAADGGGASVEAGDFQLEHLTAGFHVAALAARRQQSWALGSCGRYCRALSARRDLRLRRALCKVYEPSSSGPAENVDLELYQRSLQLYQSRTQVPLQC